MRTFIALLLLAAPALGAQGWEVVAAPTSTSLRGVSVPSADVVWVSGARGTVARSVDAGRTWNLVSVPGADSLDFRDIAAFGPDTAFVLSIGNGSASRIYRTTDGGRSWALQFSNPDSAAFFDCLDFWDARRGMAMSDPVEGRFRILTTDDAGTTWSLLPPTFSPAALDGEAGFAASGTCVVAGPAGRGWIVTGGGATARLLATSSSGRDWSARPIGPIRAGGAPRGAFSLAWLGDERLVVTGGDYEAPGDGTGVVALSEDGGASWRAPRGTPPRGYRSGVASVPGTRGRVAVAVGTSGTDYSVDGGDTWLPADTLALNAVAFATPSAGWAVGPRGRVARWRGGFPPLVPMRGKDQAP